VHALTGRDVQEALPAAAAVGAREHEPAPGVEPAVGDALRARVRAGRAPRGAHRAEADVAGDVAGEEALRDQPRRPGRQARPAPASGTRPQQVLRPIQINIDNGRRSFCGRLGEAAGCVRVPVRVERRRAGGRRRRVGESGASSLRTSFRCHRIRIPQVVAWRGGPVLRRRLRASALESFGPRV
jgi:hypothetical protein